MLPLQIYFIQFTQWLSQPLLKWKANRMGLFSILNDFCTVIKKASIPGAFVHEPNDLYIIYDFFCGIHVRLKHHNALFLSALPNRSRRQLYSTTGCFETQCIQIDEISIFENFFSSIDLSSYHFYNHWMVYYKNKKIDYMTCTLKLSDSNNPWSNKHFKRLFTFDSDFNLINIKKNNQDVDDISDSVCIQDELLLLRLLVSKPNSEVSQLFPEFYMPSVYDFNSEEFASRLKLANIL